MRKLLLILFIMNLGGLWAQTPGGISGGLTVWIGADVDAWSNNGGTVACTDGSVIQRITDQSSAGNDATDAGSDPIWREVYNSYNPTIDYSTTGGGLGFGDDADINSGSATEKTIAIAFTTGSSVTGSNQQMLFEAGSHSDGYNIYIYQGDLYCNLVDNNSNNSASTSISANTSYVLVWVWDGGAGEWVAYLNGGTTFSDLSAPSSYPGNGNNVGLGRIRGTAQYHNDGNAGETDDFEGQIHEFILFHNNAISTTDVEDITSYLGIKYGITIDQDYYFANFGSRYWDESANSTYHNDVAGWIRDDETDMYQNQAISANSDAIVSIANGSLATNNPSNGNTISGDEDYFMWGNDDGSLTFSTTGAPSNRQILGRTWLIEESGSGSIEVSVPDNSSSASTTLPAEETTIYILADTDADFSSGATEITMTLNGTEWEATTNLSSYTYFTFATESVGGGPSGVGTDATFWIKADEECWSNNGGTVACTDGSVIQRITDQSSAGNDATDSGTDPVWREVYNNYNPTIDYSTTGGGMGFGDDNDINSGSASQKTVAVAFTTGSSVTGSNQQMIFDAGGHDDGYNVYIYDGDLYCNLVDNNNNNSGSTSISANTSYVLVWIYDGDNTRWDAYLNGTLAFSDASTPSTYAGNTDNVGLGRLRGDAQYHNDGNAGETDDFEGQIHEILLFHDIVHDADNATELSSYLALKYGITISGDYESSGNSLTVWDATANSGYLNDITGIGRDDNNELYQKQSLSADSEGLVSIARGALASSNENNANTFSANEQYLVWGNDDGALSFSTTGAPASRQILGRVWKMEQTGTLSNMEFVVHDNSSSESTKLPAEETTVYLLLDTDTDFSSGATEVTMTLNGTNWEATNSVTGFNYFTFATETSVPTGPPLGPGGVGSIDGDSDLSLWLDASTITGISNGSDITSWADQSGNGYNVTVPANAPSYSATGGGNGRPAVRFDDGDSEYLYVTNNSEIMPTGNLSVLVAGNMESGSEDWAGLISTSDDNSWNDGWGIARDDNNNDMLYYVDDYAGNVCTDPFTSGQDEVWGLIFDDDANTGYGYKSENECSFSFNGPINYNGGTNDDLLIGSASDNGGPDYFLSGEIEEVIIYDEALNEAQRIIVANYLSAKYDIGLSSNDVYNEDDNGDYDYDVAGIGRVDASNIHDDAQGTGIVRMMNPTGMDNDEFLIWGHDNGDSTISENSQDVHNTLDARLRRVWRASQSDVSGSSVVITDVDIRFDLSAFTPVTASDLRLVIDLNNNGDFTDDVPVAITATDEGSNVYEFAGVTDLADNLRFTVGTIDQIQTPLGGPLALPIGPGGVVDDLDVWLRPDTGTSTTTDGASLTTWSDISTQANDATSDGNPPTYRDNLTDNFNFYPTVDFDGSNDRMVLDLSAIKSGAGNGDYTLFAVGERDDSGFNIVLGSEGGTNNEDLHFGYRNSTQVTQAHWGNDLNTSVTAWNSPGVTPYLICGLYDGSGRVMEEFRDGNFNRNTDGNTTDLGGTKTNYLGDIESVGNYDGRITEVAVFDDDLTALEKLQVYSYFIIKYGLTYTDDNDDDGTPNETISGSVEEGDLVASDGTTILWDFSSMGSTYFNDIAGIGYDTLSLLDHKQSKSVSSDALVTIGLGSIASSNLTNANSFSNHLDFLFWGNNNGSLSGATTNADLVAESGNVDQLQRIWKINEIGSVGTVQIAFPKSSIDSYLSSYTDAELYLRVADNEALTTNAVEVALSETTINGEVTYECDYDFNGTKYFTIIRKGYIVWTGSEWRGGLSTITAHHPSDEAGDVVKPMYVMSGDTGVITEAVVVDSVDIETGAVLQVDPLNCLRTDSITSDGMLILEADATGYAQYKGPAVAAIAKQYVDNDGWHLIGSPFSDATWDDLSFENSSTVFNHPVGGSSLDSCNYCNLWWYDGSTDNGTDIGFMASTAYGTWRTSTDGTQAFAPDKGWNMYFDANQNFGSAPWTIVFSGTLNDGNITQVVNENNSGWNLVANPYSTVLDWDEVDDDLAAEGIALGYHIWDHANTNFAVYSGGSGTLGATRYIAPLQGYYVQTATAGAQNGGDVFHNFNLTNDDRPNTCENTGGNNFKSSIVQKQVIKLRTTHLGSGKMDEMVIQMYDGALRQFSSDQDIRKLLTTYEDVPSLYARKGSNFTSITAMPVPNGQDSIPIGIYTADGSSVKIEAVNVPFGYSLFLEDIVTGKWHSLESAHQFEQMEQYQHRFVLHFSDQEIQARDWTRRNPFDLYFDFNGQLVIKSLKRLDNVNWYLYDMSGKVVVNGRLSALDGTTDRISVGNIKSGVYIFALDEGDTRYSEKLPKLR